MSTLTVTAPAVHIPSRTTRIIAQKPIHESVGASIEAQTVQDVLEQGNLDWTVSKRPLMTTVFPQPIPDGQINPRQFTPTEVAELMPLSDQFALVRNDLNYTFATVGLNYTVLDNKECIAIVDALMRDFGLVVRRAGTFDFGGQVWIMCELPEVLEIKGKSFRQMVKIGWSHNGTEKLSARFMYVNPYGLTESPEIPGSVTYISIRHTKSAPLRTAEARDIIGRQHEHAFKYKAIVEEMMDAEVDFSGFMMALFPKCNEEKSNDKKIATSLTETYEETGDQTKYGAYRTILDYAENFGTVRVRKQGSLGTKDVEEKREENRAKKNFSGVSLALKQKAWATLNKNK